MFKFSTTTIVNSDKDLMSDKALFSAISADDKHGAILKIKRDYTFEMPGITKVYKRVAAEPTMAEVKVDCDKLIEAIPEAAIYPVSGRLSLYIVLEGSETSVFANDFYQKGIPFSVGFRVKDSNVTGSDVAVQFMANLVKFDVATIGRQLFEASVDGSVLTLKCLGEYQRFNGIAALIDLPFHEIELAHLFDGELYNTQEVFEITERGTNGFGTFKHLMKDLRLPTAAHTSWTAPLKSDNPIPGALYNQYIIYYAAPSETNPSFVAVGDETVSKTTHIFWVNQNISESFETVVAEVVGSGPVKDDPTAIFEEV